MRRRIEELISRYSTFVWIAFATGLILMVPLIAMQFTAEVSWDLQDFIVMGLLLMGAGSLFVIISKRLPRKRRLVVGVIFAAAFLFIWAELAVGVFTGLGS